VNFNALPQAYIPPHFSIARVVVPVGIAIGIGLVIFGVIFVQHNRVYTEQLYSNLASVQSNVLQKQSAVTALGTQVASLEATADELSSRNSAMQRRRATSYEDLSQIVGLASNKVALSNIGYGGSSVAVNGMASDADDIFRYARDLRDSGRFLQVWIASISGGPGGYGFTISLRR
jgi:hypothetical protein